MPCDLCLRTGPVTEYGGRIAPERFGEASLRRMYGRIREQAHALVQPATCSPCSAMMVTYLRRWHRSRERNALESSASPIPKPGARISTG